MTLVCFRCKISRFQRWCLFRIPMVFSLLVFLLGAIRYEFFHFDSKPMLNETYAYNVPGVRTDNSQSDNFVVPNIVHYIWYNKKPKPLKFFQMLSVLSAHKILQPEVIYFHTNTPPVGEYWDRLRKLASFKVNLRQPPVTLFGEKIKAPVFFTSHSNVDRVKILMEFGGIYLDLDMIVIRPFDDLRRYPCTVGLEHETKACGSVIICSKDSPFLLLWTNSYLDNYQSNNWAYNTGQVPFNLARRYPYLVNVVKKHLNRPNYHELKFIWGSDKFRWQENYAIHIWYNFFKRSRKYYFGVEPNDENIKTWNGTFGEIGRSILYGTKPIIHSD